MFLDVHELALHKARIRKTYAPGTIDLHSADFRQVEPLEVQATAEAVEGQIRISGELHTKFELVCARCLEPVFEEVSRALATSTLDCATRNCVSVRSNSAFEMAPVPSRLCARSWSS